MNNKKSVFSWFASELKNPESVFTLMKQYKVDAVFQHVAPTDTPLAIERYLEIASHYKKGVYLLAGEPEWALYPAKLVAAIQKAGPFAGIVVDVEPYLLEEFNREPKKVMATFVASMRKAYQVAKAKRLAFVLCVPYFYDTLGFEQELEELARDCCDGLMVMNYYRGKELEHIQREAQLCRKYGKTLSTIYELQPPGMHDLKDENTYYNVGIESAYNNFNKLKQAIPKTGLSFHEFRYFKELSQKTTRLD